MSTRTTRTRVELLEVPFREPVVTGAGTWQSRRLALVRLDDDGLEGVGEIPLDQGEDLSSPFPGLPGGLVELVRIETLEDQRLLATAVGPRALALRAGLEAALADLRARVAGQPLWASMSATARAMVEVNGIVGDRDAGTAAKRAAALVDAGYRTIKLKVGAEATVDALVERVAAVRHAMGDGVHLRLDVNGGWSPEDAAARLALVAPFEPEYVEQPIAAGDVGALARLRERSPVAIAADESAADLPAAIELLERRAVDVLVVKPSRVGGPAVAREIARRAEAANVPVVMSTSFESGVGLAAALHLAATVCGDWAHGLATADLLESDLLVDGPRIVGGCLAVPTGPGIGVRLDEAVLNRYRIG